MANINLKKAGYLSVTQSFEQLTVGVSDSIEVGKVCQLDSVKGTPKLATDKAFGIAVSNSNYNQGITLIRRGIVEGYDLSSMDYGSTVFSTEDGSLSDVAGVNSIEVGKVVSGFGVSALKAPSKLLWVEITA